MTLHCVVTVHGMGEPLRNSTLMPVAERIAQAVAEGIPGDTLTLGLLSSFTGAEDPPDMTSLPVVHLRGISRGSGAGPKPVFPQPCAAGEDIFFADIFWSRITTKAFEVAGDTLPHWTECVLNRLRRKHRQLTQGRPEAKWWVLDTLALLRVTIVVVEKILGLRAKGVNQVIFGKYLGDVQLYGEYAQCRGRAVRIFHESMERIHRHLVETCGDRRVEYTFIAHSLGTVLTMDSLLFARAEHRVRAAAAGSIAGNLPFPGYASDDGRIPDTAWIDDVRSFVTLGSPIDKFLTIWWYNYEYLLGTRWMRELPPIKHYNFCDEQDPVGHRLDLARTAPAFERAFAGAAPGGPGNDILYNHTPIPGWAHVSYWKDQALFDLIFRRIIRPDAPGDILDGDMEAFQPLKPGVFPWIVIIHFFLIPVLLIGVSLFALTWTLKAESIHGIALGFTGFLLSLWFGRQVLMLNLAWRRILKQKGPQ